MGIDSMLPHFANPVEYKRARLVIDRAEGVYFWDTQGNRYLDAVAGVMVANVGYGRKEIIDAMRAQMGKLAYDFLSHRTGTRSCRQHDRLMSEGT
jgi:adenosylmethionine-8-amino-7-oxononanoate aminotransferase